VGTIVALATATASADGRTIDGAFCNDATTTPKQAFCLEASFDGQTVKGFWAGTIASCTPIPDPGVLTLRPGTYWISVVDTSPAHDFSLRSCPGSTSVCGDTPGSDELPITTDAFTSPDPVTVKVHLDHGTYRLFCANDGNPAIPANNHEAKGMYVDIVVGGVGQVG
jgi:hypothetical protein